MTELWGYQQLPHQVHVGDENKKQLFCFGFYSDAIGR